MLGGMTDQPATATGNGQQPATTPALRYERRPLTDLNLDPRNARAHDRANIDAIKESLTRFGQRLPVVVRHGQLVGGNATTIAADELGWTHLDVVISDDLDEEEARRLAIMLNRTAELATWNAPILVETLTGFDGDLAGTGFDLDQLAELESLLAKPMDGDVDAERRASLAERFIVPPFSVLDARQGYWQDRKRAWLDLGIESEIGRDARAYNKAGGADPVSERIRGMTPGDGASIFDPVLCELAYRWFCPDGGAILDPFAGGSVRGIAAAWLGHPYTGIDLSARQIAANRAQADRILTDREPAPTGPTMRVKISAAQARQRFHGCAPDYIRDVCHGACCRSSTAPTGIMVTIHPTEEAAITARGARVDHGLLQPRDGERRCPFQTGEHLCGLHGTPDKPFGCIASPFTLNRAGTLIVRNRYRLLKCYKDDRDGPAPPAYQAFRSSLNLIFGDDEAQRITDHLDDGGGDLYAAMPVESYRRLRDNDAIKHGETVDGDDDRPIPRWLEGDSRDLLPTIPADTADLIFTCPPYYDLEVYDDPRDLSRAPNYKAFLDGYAKILTDAARCLRPNRFAVIVVGEVRDKTGCYHGLIPDTIGVMEAAGCHYYNEAMLVTPIGSLPVMSARPFQASRKLAKGHQNVLVFFKGDPRSIADTYGEVEVGPLTDEANLDVDALAG
jgi:hypothetical protein